MKPAGPSPVIITQIGAQIVYGYYAKYFSHDDGVEHSRSYGSEFVISTNSEEGKDIVFDNLPLNYGKKEYVGS